VTTSCHRTIDAIWRIESARIVAALVRVVRDVGLAEELGQDALVAALEQWPTSGVPDNPGAWLMTVARRRAVDLVRQQQRRDRAHDQYGRGIAARPATAVADQSATAVDEQGLEDDVLRLMFICCHPVLPASSRVALTLRLVGGLTTREIARAFLVGEPTAAQRIVRAKRTLAESGATLETPTGTEREHRLSSVCDVLYLLFNEGYAASGGSDWIRPDLCRQALRLGRMLAGLAPEKPEVHGLVALMEIQASRLPSRVDRNGNPVLLAEQDRSRWDQLLIRRGLAALNRAEASGRPLGPYTVQAAIAACHARARTVEDTDWQRIAALYEVLGVLTPTPVVLLNRAVAVGQAFGPAKGLELVDAIANDPALRGYHLLPSVRGDLLARLGRPTDAVAEFDRAAELASNESERALLLRRAADTISP
jgi:RNA polymerase sigma factor (sigma-70 family)